VEGVAREKGEWCEASRKRVGETELSPPWLSPPGVLPNPESKFIHPFRFSTNIPLALPSYNFSSSKASNLPRSERAFKRI
jgi:hypothetical protein